jgi:hypothetical protein
MTDDAEPILFEQPGIRITSSAIFIGSQRIPHAEIASVESGWRAELGPPAVLITFGLSLLVAAGVLVALQSSIADDASAFALMVVIGSALAGVGAFQRWRLKDRFMVGVSLRSGARVAVVMTRTELQAEPLRQALVRAIGTCGAGDHVPATPAAG